MKFSENWLRSLVAIDADRDALCHRLTMAGLEVESVTPLGDGLAGVVVGEIVACEKHPDADKLRVCRVATGGAEPLQIVCGAPNARVGLKAPLATVGTTLPGGLAIKAATLRGVASAGMLCSAKELALDADGAGLMELPEDAPTGMALADYLGLPDTTIELKLTPNRPDCLGLRGLASEVATLFRVTRRETPVEAVEATSAARREVRLEAPTDCPRYVGRVIEGIDAAAPSPPWLRERLRRAGLRPISAVVDCTNYVMLELGQPMHAFDHDRLDGAIAVRRAHPGETLTLLDGRDVALDDGFLAITDARGPVALAGVMGGHESRVTDTTRNLFLEAAHFAPPAIVGRARRLGMHTDAAHRFERGVDPELPRLAMERITALLLAIVGGRAGPVVEAVEPARLPVPPSVRLRATRLRRVLGMAVPSAEVEAILRGLDMTVTRDGEDWTVVPPSRRFDVAIEEDLIEEVARVHGYERVPVRPPAGELPRAEQSEGAVEPGTLRRALAARGYAEALNFSFLAPETLATWGLAADAVALANPLSADLAVMRTALLPGLVEALRRNRARQQERIRLFEIGAAFARRAGAAPQETTRLALVATGAAASEQWAVARRPLDFFDLKGDLEQLLALTGQPAAFRFVADGMPDWLHPGRAARILRGAATVGFAGALHPRLIRALDLDAGTFAAELDLSAVLARGVARAGHRSRHPLVRRDIAVVLDRRHAYADVEAAVRAAVGARLQSLVLFDEYAGTGLPEGARSLAIGLILQDDYRTLTDEDAEASVGAAVAALKATFGAELRS